MAFSFGGSSDPNFTFGAPGSGSAFGGGSSTPVPGASSGPSATGFSGGGTSVPPATGRVPPPATVPTGNAPPVFTGGGLFGGPAATHATTQAGPASAPQPTIVVPEYDTLFENIATWKAVQNLCATAVDDESSFRSGQEIVHYISTHAASALKPQLVEWTQPSAGIRHQLEQDPVIGLGAATNITTLTPKARKRVFSLSTDLRISEAHATTLYAQVSEYADTIEGLISNAIGTINPSIVDQVLPQNKYSKVSKLAREFYFYERHLKLETLLFLVQKRFETDPNIILATDTLLQNGLVSDLIAVTRQYTDRIMQIQEEIKANTAGQTGQYGRPMQGHQPARESDATSVSFAQLHLLFCQRERQTAVEALFFISYHTQLEILELTSLIDLIRDLSNLTPRLNPFHDVSSPYEEGNAGGGSHVNQQFSSPPWSSLGGGAQSLPWQWREKSPLQWQHDLVREVSQSGQPQIMQCNSLLIIAAMAAMETRQILFNRELHGPNEFGRGNMLLPPHQEALDVISVLNRKLSPNANAEWNRKDIWGVLAFSYALLLRSSSSVITSPRKGGSTTHLSKEVREAANDCMVKPTEVMSFTFCRETMIPVLQNLKTFSRHSSISVSEFGLSVLAEVYSLYLSVLAEGAGNLPISRKRWESEAEVELRLLRDQQSQQRQFHAWSGNQSQESFGETIPTVVDLTTRPECLDDLIALASSLCSLGEDYASKFWESSSADGSLFPSKALLECITQASQDDSVLPSVLSWLAALSNDEKSANAVNSLLTTTSDIASESTGSVSLKTSWYTIIFNLRWYAQELTPSDNISTTVSKQPSAPSTVYEENASYYYNSEIFFSSDSKPAISTNSQRNSSSKKPRPKELSEAARFRVTSHLALLMNVSLHCAQARYEILRLKLPVGDGGLVVGEDESLLVLFKLAISPLMPRIRGAALSTIASLVKPTEGISDVQVKSFLEEQAKHAWEYLESCPLLPIALLDRYRILGNSLSSSRDQVGLLFPPSSMTLAGSLPEPKSVLPKDPIYGILYEMEHIESKNGWYPSTEGFLELLAALIRSVGCPTNLGENFRARAGCTPYIEYVLDFVLTRALGVKNQPVLPFRVKGDQSRLVSRALQVVHAVLIRYDLSTVAFDAEALRPATMLGIQADFDKIASSTSVDVQQLSNDFKNLSSSVSRLLSASGSNTMSGTSGSSAVSNETTSIPTPKSPGFTILFEILSSSFGTLLQSLAILLTENDGPKGIFPVFGQQSDAIRLVYALYGSTPPDLSSAKEGSKEGGPTKPLQNLLKPILPKLDTANIDETYFDDGVMWRESSISLALQILSIASFQEDRFLAAIAAVKEPLKLVPVLDFQQSKSGSRFKSIDVRVSRLTDLFFSMENSEDLRRSITQCIAYQASDEWRDREISAAALSIVHRLQQSLPAGNVLIAFSGDVREQLLSNSVARRMVIAGNRLDKVDVSVLILILNWILSELRSGIVANDGLAQQLMGLPNATTDGNWKRQGHHVVGSAVDCFDAILEILRNGYSESTGSSEVYSLCFEVIFRLYDLTKYGNVTSWRITLYTARRLREVDFWTDSLLSLPLYTVSSWNPSDANQIMHSMAWLLKGLSAELKLLVGFASEAVLDSELSLLLSPHPGLFDSLLSILFGSEGEQALLHNLLVNLPLERKAIDPSLVYPREEALKVAAYSLPGAMEVVRGYEALACDKAIAAMAKTCSSEDKDATRKWIDEWNLVVEHDCAVSHLSSSISLLIDGAFYSSDSIESYTLDSFSGLSRSQVWLRNGGARDLLAAILGRLHVEHAVGDHLGMDLFLLPNATKNLSAGVVVVSEFIASDAGNSSTSPSDRLRLCCMLSRVVYISSVGDDAAAEAPLRHERTVSLGGSLALILQAAASAEPTVAHEYKDDFAMAAEALARVSCFKVDTRVADSLSVASLLGRSSLASIILSLNEEDDSLDDQTIFFALMQRPFIESLLGLVVNLDDDICNLLQTVALRLTGARLLIKSGIGHSLKAAARMYCEQEHSAVQGLKQRGPTYVESRIRSPFFLLSHLQLILSLLTSVGQLNDLYVSFSYTCMEILGTYKKVMQRLCFNFPVEADVLRCFVKCLVMTHSASQKLDDSKLGNSAYISKQDSSIKEVFSAAGILENGLFMLIEQISENPLPIDMLPPFPNELTDSTVNPESETINIGKEASSTWWDVLESILKSRERRSNFVFAAPMGRNELAWLGKVPNNWNEDKFEFSIIAVETLSLGLSLVKRFNRIDLIQGSSIARGLFMCAFAAGCVGRRLEEVRFRLGNASSIVDTDDNANIELEIEYLELLMTALTRSVEEMLTLGVMMTRDSKENGRVSIPNELIVAVNASGLEYVQLLQGGSRELVSILCKQIEKGGR